MSVAGLGWCTAATASDAVALVRQSMQESGATALSCLAVPQFKQGEGPQGEGFPEAVAALLDVPVCWISNADLQATEASCQTISEKSLQQKGFAAVAEGCALAAVGPGAWLRVPRRVYAGITCAVAEREGVR